MPEHDKKFIAFCFILLIIWNAFLTVGISHLIQSLPDAVMQAIDKDVSLSAMRNSKIDCEQKIPRTQECIILYEYIPVNK